MRNHTVRGALLCVVAMVGGLLPLVLSPQAARAAEPAVSIVSPEDGGILDGTVTLLASVTDTTAESVEFFYDPHEDDEPAISLGMAAYDSGSGLWTLDWDTTDVPDTFNDLDTDGDGTEDTTAQLTKPATLDRLRVVADPDLDTPDDELSSGIDVRVQNMLTVRFTLPDNQEDLRGFEDLEAVLTSQHEITGVRFDLYDPNAATGIPDDLFTPFGEFESLGEPIVNRQYGRPLGNPAYPTGTPAHEIGTAVPEGPQRWVLRGWDTTTVPDGTWHLVARATDSEGRTASYVVETYVVNDLRVQITAPTDGDDDLSRFVALEARTSSLTGADNAAPGSLWPATAVAFEIDGTTIDATETPEGSGRWRAVWDSDTSGPGTYDVTATAINENPGGAETATDTIGVTVVAPGADLEAFFPTDWSNCTLLDCAFLDGSGGTPTSWLWDFGDGSTSTDQLPTHTYAEPGVYTVSLTVGDGVDTDTYERDIPVGNTGVVSFNRNNLDLGGPDDEFIDWTSAFKNFEYEVGDTLAIPVMWSTTVGDAGFLSMPEEVCDDDEDTSNQVCVTFTPEEAFGTAPHDIVPADSGVLFEIEFTEVQLRGITDVFKGKVNLRATVGVDADGNGSVDQENQLGVNVDVTNSGVEGDEDRVVKINRPPEGEAIAGLRNVTASVVSMVTAEQVEFFADGESIGTDDDGSNGWGVAWDTTTVPDSPMDDPYELTAVATFGTDDGAEAETSAVRNVFVLNTRPPEPDAPPGTFQVGRTNDTSGKYLTYRYELEEEGDGGGPRPAELRLPGARMASSFSNIVVTPGGGVIGGDLLELDVTMTNTSPVGSGIVLSAFAFQSKFSESPALGSRVGDKAFYGQLVGGGQEGRMTSVKKNGTSQGLFTGKWKGICINSSTDFIPEFNSGLEDESLECAGNRADTDEDGEPELQTGGDMLGLRPGESQTVRLQIDSGTTDGALHVVEPGTLQGQVEATEVLGPNGVTYLLPNIVDPADPAAPLDPTNNVVGIPDFGDNKVLRDADGTFNPTFAPASDGLRFDEQTFLTLPRRNFAFTDIIGRNHTCATYGLTNGACSGGGSPELGFLDDGDLVPGVENFAAILRGFGEFHDGNGDLVPDENPEFPGSGETRPSFPYDVLCDNCGGIPYVPIAEFFKDNGDGSLTQSLVAGTYGDPQTEPYDATIDASQSDEVKEEVFPEPDPGGPCDPVEDPSSRRPSCLQLRTSATGQFHDLTVVEGAGINGGDAVEFTVDVTNTSVNPEAYLTSFNYQTKRRGLADIGILDGYTQDRRDIRVDPTLPPCASLDDAACYNAALSIGHFPNVIGNGLLFGQMVWTDDDAGREGPVIPDQVHVDPATGIDPTPYRLESVKKNGPFSPILKGNTNFICLKSGLFDNDPDADAGCAGEAALLVDPDGELVPGNFDTSQPGNPNGRLGLRPGETQSVRVRMEWGDFRGAMLQVVAGAINSGNVSSAYTDTQGLAREFDCSDQRELEFCHPQLNGEIIGYLPNTLDNPDPEAAARWLTPETLEEIEYVIINQPGDAPSLMDFQANFGQILGMSGFVPSAEFYAPDPSPDLVGTPFEGVLIRQQVLGEYGMTEVPESAPEITSTAVTTGAVGSPYRYDVDAVAYPGPVTYSLVDGPTGMSVDSDSGVVTWTPAVSGTFPVTVRATNGSGSPATQSFTVTVPTVVLDSFDRANGKLGGNWGGVVSQYTVAGKQADIGTIGGPIYWRTGFGATQTVSVKLTKIATLGQHAVFLKGNADHLKLSAILVNYDNVGKRIQVISQQHGKTPKVVGTFRTTLRAGDQLAATALANGQVRVHVNGTQVGTADAGAYFVNRGGHIGTNHLLAGTAFFDDFSGGTVAP